MTPAQTADGPAILISVIALGIALLAALFTAWQAWIAHKTRQDAQRVYLSIVHVDTPDGPRGSWVIRNNGHGDALDPIVSIVFRLGESRHEFAGYFDGVLNGLARAKLTFDRPPPVPESAIKDHPDKKVIDCLQATVEYSRPGRARRLKSKILIAKDAEFPNAVGTRTR